MNFTGQNTIQVFRSEGITLVSRENSVVGVAGQSTVNTITVDAEWDVFISEGSIQVSGGTLFGQSNAFTNNGGFNRWPGAHVPAGGVEGLTEGPTSGYVYFEMGIGGAGPAVGGPEPSVPSAGGVGLDEGLGYFDRYASASITYTSSGPGSPYSFSFYADRMESTNTFLRIPIATVVLDGLGNPVSVNRLHYGTITVPYGMIFEASLAVAQD